MFDSYTKAVECFNRSEYNTAENLLMDRLNDNKNDYRALNFLGIIKMNLGDFHGATEYFKQSIEIHNNDFNAHYNLGLCCQHLEDYETALKEYQISLELNPNNIDALNNSGLAFSLSDKYEQAEKCYKLALRLSPNNQKALINLANLKLKNEKFDEAEELYISILKLYGNNEVNYYNLGNLYLKIEKYDKAVSCYQEALRINPNYFQALNNLGCAFQNLGSYKDAINIYYSALNLSKDKGDLYFNIAKCYQELKEYDNAVELFSKAIELNPGLVGAYINIGDILWEQGRKEEAQKYYRSAAKNDTQLKGYYAYFGLRALSPKNLTKAIRYFDIALSVDKDNPDLHYNKSHIFLLTGNIRKGWAEYEWRLKRKDYPQRNLSGPFLSTKNISGKKILVYDEQGIGDSIQFVRYLPLLKEKGATVIYECYDSVKCLYKDFDFIDTLIENKGGEPDIEYDYQIPLLSLPNYFGTTLESIPENIPYLFAEQELSGFWRNKIRNNDRLKVGIVWAGSPTHANDKNRSCRLEDFSSLLSLEGIDFYSLQKGEASRQVEDYLKYITDLDGEIKTFADTAAIIANLDLVITVDTSIVHLAGAMGKNVWLLLPYLPDWRWLLDRDDSPWYPTAHLFRQNETKNWNTVVDSIKSELLKLVKDKFGESILSDNYVPSKSKNLFDNVLYLGLPQNGNFGWGVCSKYLKQELSKKIQVIDTQNINNTNLIDGDVFHALSSYEFESVIKLRGKRNFAYTFFESELIDKSVENASKYDIILGGSTWCKERMDVKGIKNSDVLIQGIDPELFYPVPERNQDNLFIIFSGGKFELRKGQDLVIKAFEILHKKYPDMILINAWYNFWPQSIVTMAHSRYINFDLKNGTWNEFMTNILIKNNINPRKVFTLPITPNDRMRELYSKTDIGLFPNRCEGGTNLVLMEYMACGKPVIASYNSGHKDILTNKNSIMLETMKPYNLLIENEQLTFDWEEPDLDEIIEKIEFAYHNRDAIKTIGKNAAEDMKKFTWEKTAENLIKIIYGYN